MYPLLDLGVWGVLLDTANRPAHDFRTASPNPRSDQGVHHRQIGRPQPGPHSSEPLCLIRHIRPHAEEHAREAAQNSTRGPPGRAVRNELDPCDSRKQTVVMQLLGSLAVGLLECLQNLLVVLPALCRLACPVHESPYGGLPRLHIWIVAVPRTSARVNVPSGKADRSCFSTESDTALSTRSSRSCTSFCELHV